MQRLEKSSSLAGGSQRKNLTKRLSPVTVAVFLLARDFSVGAIEFFEKKYRVVSEAVFAARLFCQDAFREIGDNSEDAALRDRIQIPTSSLFAEKVGELEFSNSE
jgi:hypothetical protein